MLMNVKPAKSWTSSEQLNTFFSLHHRSLLSTSSSSSHSGVSPYNHHRFEFMVKLRSILSQKEFLKFANQQTGLKKVRIARQ